MLRQVSKDVTTHYYDPRYHGVDWEARVAAASANIEEAQSLDVALAQIAAVLSSLEDSHTYFLPPERADHHEYGWRSQVVGDRCLITHVKPLSDAEAKGLRPGDELLAINGLPLSRKNLARVEYIINLLFPQLFLQLQVRTPSGEERQLEIQAHVERIMGSGRGGAATTIDFIRATEEEGRVKQARAVGLAGKRIVVVKIPELLFSEKTIARMMDDTREYPAMILDLRGNPGGYLDTLKTFVGALFGGRELEIGQRVTRDKAEPIVAEATGEPGYAGKLIVLIDGGSASASEVLARVVQLEKRGIVMGDRSDGHVMVGVAFTHHVGVSSAVYLYGASITVADLIMSDGKSLERTGVVPDELVLPTPDDLAEGRDPVLAHAIETLGGQITAEEAGRLFPWLWPSR